MKRSTKRMMGTIALVIIALFVGFGIAKFASFETVEGLEDAAEAEVEVVETETIEDEAVATAAAPATSNGNTTTNKSNTTTSTSTGTTKLADLYNEEGRVEDNLITTDSNSINVEELTAEEVIAVIDAIVEASDDATIADIATMANVTVEQAAAAITEVNNDRIQAAFEAWEAGNKTYTTDVGTSTVETATVTTTAPSETRSNGTSEMGKVDNDTIAIQVEDHSTTTIATKTMVRVYTPNGDYYEYVIEGTEWGTVELKGGYGVYTINVYQDVDGNGYTFVSRYTEEKVDPNAGSTFEQVSLEEAAQEAIDNGDEFVDVDWSVFGF